MTRVLVDDNGRLAALTRDAQRNLEALLVNYGGVGPLDLSPNDLKRLLESAKGRSDPQAGEALSQLVRSSELAELLDQWLLRHYICKFVQTVMKQLGEAATVLRVGADQLEACWVRYCYQRAARGDKTATKPVIGADLSSRAETLLNANGMNENVFSRECEDILTMIGPGRPFNPAFDYRSFLRRLVEQHAESQKASRDAQPTSSPMAPATATC